jgi:hypothetical protein
VHVSELCCVVPELCCVVPQLCCVVPQLCCVVPEFRYWGTTVTNQNLIQKEIKRRLNSGNDCYHTVQKLLSSRLLSKNVQLKYTNL